MTDPMAALPTLKSPASELTGRVVARPDLTPDQLDQMHGLLSTFFEGVTRERFAADLAEKEWVILLVRPGTGEVRGFSTLMRLEAVVAGERVVAYFSGDTIIHRDDWGSSELPRTWIRHAMELAGGEGGAPVYWYLISSGYKTYRFLPVFFREFYPTWERPTPPDVKATLDELGRLKFGSEYDPAAGVIRFGQAAPLRDGVAEVTERRLKDPAVAFFVQANPGHVQGDELACLTRLDPANFTPAGRRMLGVRA